MLTGILSVAFLIGVPVWLVIEEVLHQGRARSSAARLAEVRRPGRRTVVSDYARHATY